MNIIDFEKEYTYSRYVQDSIALSRRFAPFLQLESIGMSCDDREILLFRLGQGSPSVVFTAGVHGRENINPIVLLALVEELCQRYDAGQAPMLQQYSMLFLPMLNPDGYEISKCGYDGISYPAHRMVCKSSMIPSEEYKYNARAIDLNRNFPCSSFHALPHTGEAASEPETQAFLRLLQKEDTLGYLDFHSRGECIYYFRSAMPDSYNVRQKQIALALAKSCAYQLADPELEIESGDSGGNTVHFYSEFIKRPALTIETIPEAETFPLRRDLSYQVLSRIRELPMDFLNIVC